MRIILISAFVFASAIIAGNVAHAAPVYNVDGKQVSEIQRCGMEWKATGGKSHKDVRWPQYWSACARAIKMDKTAGAAKIGTMKIDLSALPKVEPINVAK